MQRMEINLGILNRKNKEAIEAVIEELSAKRNNLPRLSDERGKLNDVITKLKSKDADVLSILDYLPDGTYKPEEGLIKEALELRTRRVDALKKFWPAKWTVFKRSAKTAKRVNDLGFLNAFVRIFSGDVGPAIGKIYNSPKMLLRVLGTEFGSRLLGLPLVLGGFETLMDYISMSSNPTTEITPQWLEDHPELAKTLQDPGILGIGGAGDYKDYERLHWSVDMLANLTNNTMKKFDVTIPAYAIANIMEKTSSAGGGANAAGGDA